MKINCLATGSSGNALTVSDGQTTLLLDAGIPYKELARQVRVSELSGVLITHEHMDHARATSELSRRGANLYMSKGTIHALGLDQTSTKAVSHNRQFAVGSWMIGAFDAVHDCAEPMGFAVWSKVTDTTAIYIVDSGIVRFDFDRMFEGRGVNYWLLEANYAEDILEKSDAHEALKARIRRNHMGLEDVKTLLRTSDLSKAEEIWLLHLSDNHSNEARFVSDIQKLTGVPTFAPPSKPQHHGELHRHRI